MSYCAWIHNVPARLPSNPAAAGAQRIKSFGIRVCRGPLEIPRARRMRSRFRSGRLNRCRGAANVETAQDRALHRRAASTFVDAAGRSLREALGLGFQTLLNRGHETNLVCRRNHQLVTIAVTDQQPVQRQCGARCRIARRLNPGNLSQRHNP